MSNKPKPHRARMLRFASTDAEKRLWQALRHRQLYGYKFRRQVPVGPYIADFVCHRPPLVVEIDGGQHAEQAIRDGQRTNCLNREGFAVIRFWNTEVLQNLDGVPVRILEELGRLD